MLIAGAAVLAAGATSCVVGYWVCKDLFGWWPTSRGGQKVTLLAVFVPGALLAMLGWGDPTAPVVVKQFGDRLTVTFEAERISREFWNRNKALFTRRRGG